MPRNKNTRAAQGTGTIRKKTVTRNGKPYEFWEARYTVGRDPGTGKQIQRSISGKTQKEVVHMMWQGFNKNGNKEKVAREIASYIVEEAMMGNREEMGKKALDCESEVQYSRKTAACKMPIVYINITVSYIKQREMNQSCLVYVEILWSTSYNLMLYPTQVFGHFQKDQCKLYCSHSKRKAEFTKLQSGGNHYD